MKVVLVILLSCLVLLSGCKKKKPAVPQPQEQAPAISAPEPTPEPEQPVTEAPPPAEKAPEAPATATTPKPKVTPKKPVAKKPTTTPAPKPQENAPSKTVVTNGSTNENSQLSAGLPESKEVQQRQNTTQLQTAAEANLRKLTRVLNSDEQAMVQQIRTFVAQSRSASAEGDIERAYNLAMKARLLSDELVKR
jgi:hypothetical protein